MQFFFGALSKAWKRSRRSPLAGVPAQDASPPNDPHSYTVTVCRNEVALGRFIKRLSVSGAEHIKVDYARNGVVHVRMQRPPTAANWDATVSRLVDQCNLRATASTPGDPADRKPAR